MVAVLFLPASMALSDSMSICSVPDVRAARPMLTTDVEMVAESVLIVPAGREIHGIPVMQVTCIFHLRNLTDRHLNIEAGFPFEYFDFEGPRRYESNILQDILKYMYSSETADARVPEWLSFRAILNDEVLPVYYLKGLPDIDNRLFFFPLIAAWNMEFEAAETVRLVNTYFTGWNNMRYGFWDSYELSYIVRSGSVWSGSIGDAFIQIQVPEEFPLPYAGRDMGAWWEWTGSPCVEDRTITWHYSDWEPEEDIRLRILAARYPVIPELTELVFDPSKVTWTEEDLVPSLKESLGLRYFYPPLSPEFIADMGEVALYAQSGMEHPEYSIDCYSEFCYCDLGDGRGVIFRRDSLPFDYSRLELITAWREEQVRLKELVGDQCFKILLPPLSVRRTWSEANLEMFAADPDIQIQYLLMLENLEQALEGISPSDPGIAALYALTGWYLEGYPYISNNDLMNQEIIGPGEFLLQRRVVRDFWLTGGGCGVPLVCASLDGSINQQEEGFVYRASSEMHPQSGISCQIENLSDGNPATAWIEGTDGYGYNENFSVQLLQDYSMSGFMILNGYCSNVEAWTRNGRIAKLVVSLNNVPLYVVELQDERCNQTVLFGSPLSLMEGDSLVFTILEVYPGTDFSDTAVSELCFF